MPAYARRGDSDVPEPVPDEPQPSRKRGGRGRMKAEPSADPADSYATSLPPDQAMAASAIIGPPGAHDIRGQAGLGTGVSN
jgi:hypothetical protein